MKTKYKGHIVGDPNIDELLEELERASWHSAEEAAGDERRRGVSTKQPSFKFL